MARAKAKVKRARAPAIETSALVVRERAIEVMAFEPTDDLGVSAVVAKGLATKREAVSWLADPEFAASVQRRRDERLGSVVEQVKEIAKASAAQVMQKLVAIALGKERAKRYQVEAIRAVLDRADVEHSTAGAPAFFAAIFARIQTNSPAPAREVGGDDSDDRS